MRWCGQNSSYRIMSLCTMRMAHVILIWYTGWKFSFQSTETFLNVHWILTDCSLKSGFQALFSDLSVDIQSHWMLLNGRHISVTIQYFFLIFRVKNSKNFHQIRGIKLILLWITTHEIKKKKLCPRRGLNQDIFILVVPKPVRYFCGMLLHIVSELIWILICIHF